MCSNSADGSNIDLVLVERNDIHAVESQSAWYSYPYADGGASNDARIVEDVARSLLLFREAAAANGAPRRPS